jgi:hypothetical protein
MMRVLEREERRTCFRHIGSCCQTDGFGANSSYQKINTLLLGGIARSFTMKYDAWANSADPVQIC